MKKWYIAIIFVVAITLPLVYYANLNFANKNCQQIIQQPIDNFSGSNPIVTLPTVNMNSVDVKIEGVNHFDTIHWYRIYYREGHYYSLYDTNGKLIQDGYDWSDADWKLAYMFKSTNENGNKRQSIDVTINGLSPNNLYEVKVVAEEYDLYIKQVRTLSGK